MPADAYVSFMLFMSLLVGLIVALNAAFVGYAVTKIPAFALVVAVPSLIVSASIALAITYNYPSILAGKKKRAIEEGLPYTVSFMGILASSGVPATRVMRSLALLEKANVGLGGESSVMYRDMELLGENMVTALENEAKKNISPLLTGVLEGFVSTIRSGGDLAEYFREQSTSLMRLRRAILKEFVDVLVLVSEVYMSLMVLFPLILIVMLVVMSSIGGGTLGGMTPEAIVPLIVYGMVPGAGVVVIMMLDSMSPAG
ncbi:MAG: type II secretion system F family protein [Nitrososphaerota archaeon]|nr:type II secretion system F family protein [Nitrososphaerota archaeon]